MSRAVNDISLPEPRPASAEALAAEIVDRLTYRVGKDPKVATAHDWMEAAILVTRDRAVDHWMASTRDTYDRDVKRVYYLSLEFLIGRLLRDAVSNLGLLEPMREALGRWGSISTRSPGWRPTRRWATAAWGGWRRVSWRAWRRWACRPTATASGTGTGCSGRRSSTANRPSCPRPGWSTATPGNSTAARRPTRSASAGRSAFEDANGGPERFTWTPAERVIATAFDTPVVGWRAARVNTLRLWESYPLDPIRLDKFNAGDHVGSMSESNRADALTRVLYPADASPSGQELRLRQEYFFSSASIQDILRRHLQSNDDLGNLADKVAIQLNDTHPAVVVPELMRLLMDVHGYDFKAAWEITKATVSYTNHTLLPEALESWPVPLFERLLPRHMQIIYEINAVLLRSARATGMDDGVIREISLIDEDGERRVRMGNLAFVGAHSINGVSGLHTELMKKTVFKGLHALHPLRINAKTNGITPRRWLMQCNPGLFGLIRETIGDAFLDDIDALRGLEAHAGDAGFQEAFAAVKRANKERLAALTRERTGIRVDPDAMFDIQIKRIHEYKRQLMNIIEAVALYDQIRSHPERDWTPRVKFFAGKAAPTYHMAKLIIRLANDVARVINSNPSTRDVLKVAFLPNYNVSLAEVLVPAADLSEQISTAGMEASGTGNMKFALNGALTIGTMDGANVEISEHVGRENMFIFGLSGGRRSPRSGAADTIRARRSRPRRNSARRCRRSGRACSRRTIRDATAI